MKLPSAETRHFPILDSGMEEEGRGPVLIFPSILRKSSEII